MKSLLKSFAAAAVLVGSTTYARAGWNDAYRHLEYVETTGSQWINTGVVPSSTDTIELRVRFVEQTDAVSWCSRGSSATDRSFSVFTQNGRYRCDRAGTQTATAMTVDITAPHLVRAAANVYSVDGATICTQGTDAYTPVGPLVLAAAYSLANGEPNPAAFAKERIYRFRVANSSGETLHDFWPCQRIEDSVAGLYDTVGGAFVASSSATALVAGPEAYVLDENKFTYRSMITFPGKGTAGAQQCFPVPVRISAKTVSGFSYAQIAANGADIRFYDADGVLVPHEIELWDSSSDEAESVVWVSVPDFSKTASVTMYWGGKGAEQPLLEASNVWSRAAYVGVWHMGDAENGQVKDSSGHGIDGAVTAGNEAKCVATNYCAVVGKATYASCLINFPNYCNLVKPGASFQWSCWTKATRSFGDNYFPIFLKKSWNSNSGWYVCYQGGSSKIGGNGAGGSPAGVAIGHNISRETPTYLASLFANAGNFLSVTEHGQVWSNVSTASDPSLTDVPTWQMNDVGGIPCVYDEVRIRDYTDMSGSGSTYYDPYVAGLQASWAKEEMASMNASDYCAFTPASAIGMGTLTIETALENVGTVDPDYTPGFALPNAGDTRDCTAERYFAYDNKLYACAGYDLRTKTADGWSEPVHIDSLSYTYVQDSVTKRLTWRWEVVGYSLVTKGDSDGVEACAVTTNGVPVEPVLTKDGVGYYFAGITYELTPPTNNGFVDCDFLDWVSGVSAGHESDVPLRVTLEAPVTVVGRYRRHGWTLAEEGTVLTDGCWKFTVTDDGAGGLTLTERLAGTHPVLDFTSCSDSTGKRVVGVAASVFYGHATLAQFTGPDVVALGELAMKSCQALTNVVLSADFSSFALDSLCSCQNLRSVVPSTFLKLTSIPRGVFYQDYKLSGTLCFPEVTSIGQLAFTGANGAPMVSALSIIAPKVKTIGDEAFNSCYMVTNLVFSDALETVGDNAFCRTERLQHFEPFLPKGLKSLGTYTFYWSSVKADKVTIDAPNLTTLPKGMFAIARSIREIEISSPINKIDDYALSCLAAGVKVTFAGDKPATLATKWLSAAAVARSPWNPTAGDVVKPYASLCANLTKFPAWKSLVAYDRDSAEFAAARADAATGYPGARTAGLADIGGFKSWVVDTTPRGFMIVVE